MFTRKILGVSVVSLLLLSSPAWAWEPGEPEPHPLGDPVERRQWGEHQTKKMFRELEEDMHRQEVIEKLNEIREAQEWEQMERFLERD